jgi:nucleoid-associated protein YgaU
LSKRQRYNNINSRTAVMQRDFKIGVFLGLFILIIAAVLLSVNPNFSVRARLQAIQNNPAQKESPLDSIFKSSTPANSSTNRQIKSQQADKKRDSDVSKPEPPPQNSQQPVAQRYHLVMKDQTLSDIAQIYYGSPAQWTKIRDANPDIDPKKIRPGTRLLIPP